VQRDTYEPAKEQKVEQDIIVEDNNYIPTSGEELNIPEKNENTVDPKIIEDKPSTETDFQHEKEQTTNKQQEENSEVNVSEKLITFLNSSETGLNKVKGHVDNVRFMVEEVTFKLDSMMSILDIIHNSEDRRMKGPQATISSQKESKDTIDEILEMLQNPAIQSMLRQFMMGIIGKKNISYKPES
jgi:hypothetical protein